MELRVRRRVFGDFEQRLEDVLSQSVRQSSVRSMRRVNRYSLLTTSSKLSTSPPPLNTSYSLGTWMSHRTLCEMSLLFTTHRASLSHSWMFLMVS